MKNPSQKTLIFILNNPSSIKTISQTKQLHAQILKLQTTRKFKASTSTTLLSIYTNFNLYKTCLSLFKTLHFPPPSKAWKSLIKVSTSTSHFSHSLTLFNQMRASGKTPDINVFPSVLKSCALLQDLKLGQSVHGFVVKCGLESDLFTGNGLMNFYGKIEFLGFGTKVFDEMSQWKVFDTMPVRDMVSWNTVIGGCVRNGMGEEGLCILREMGKVEVKIDSFSLSSVLPVIARCGGVVTGKEVHGFVIRRGFDGDVFVGSGLIDMYAGCLNLDYSCRVFDLSCDKDSVLWNSVIAGCVRNGSFDKGLELFREMLLDGVEPVGVSFASVIPACAHLTTLCLGKELHGCVLRRGFDDNIYVCSSLVDMYAKCGKLSIAKCVFDNMEFGDTISWTAMVMGYAVHGHACDAISMFERMENEGIKPNFGSFVAVLTACSHAGLVDESLKYFKSMIRDYGISPGIEHYSAVSDLLSRAGRLDEAYEFISSMHIEATGAVWSTLLSACRVHKNVELAEKVAKEMFRCEPDNVSAYVLLSNVYIAAGRHKDAAKLRIKTRKKGIIKKAACSWIEVKNNVHVFVSGEENHPDYPRINKAIQDLMEWIELQGGSFRNTNMALLDVD